jgi:hypothetical protein
LVSDNAFLATAITALLIRQGGRTVFSAEEWKKAIEHEGTLYLHRNDEKEEVLVVLLPREAGQA